ncbi:Rna-binding protein 39 isoform x1 [Gryllus bimaculatus]|nr:Rna-binding protein 39 isoform x1 [Gryllus bimaculatus]
MAEDLDVEAMLEAPYKKGDDVSTNKISSQQENGTSNSHRSSGKSKHRSRSRSHERDRHRSRSRDRHRGEREKDKERDRHRERGERGDRERDRERRRSKEKDRHDKERRRSKDREHRRKEKEREKEKEKEKGERERRKRSLSPITLPRARDKFPFKKGASPLGLRALDDLSPEERDARTVFCMQLSQRIRARDLEEFFSSVGKVRDVRLITCNKTRRFKGIAYVEFRDPESVPLKTCFVGYLNHLEKLTAFS